MLYTKIFARRRELQAEMDRTLHEAGKSRTVRKAGKSAQPRIRNKSRRGTQATRQLAREMAALFESGMPLAAIGDRYGCTAEDVWALLQQWLGFTERERAALESRQET